MKNTVCLIIVVLVFLFASSIPGYTADGGGHHGGGGYHGSWHGSIWIGPGWWPGWSPAYYPYYYSYYPYYPETPAVIQQQPSVYVQPKEQYYWYFCQKPVGYYPYVKECPGGWLKVVPPAPPDEKE
jgi:hypothetical protein